MNGTAMPSDINEQPADVPTPNELATPDVLAGDSIAAVEGE